MSKRDTRYDLIEPMIATGKITSFNDIFKYIPKTVVARDLGKKVDRFSELMVRVDKFTLEDLFIIARFCSIDEITILTLVKAEYLKNKSKIQRRGGQPDDETDDPKSK
ncbi:MAG TPA: hypothetical protein VGM30_14590 [Puia sp.]|jgi:hypothetical protein